MPKRFTKKQIEKLFAEKYPEGELFLQNGNWFFAKNENEICKKLRVNNLYDIAEMLNLIDINTINAMKKAAGYVSYQSF
jgi:hypothetical protein